MTDPNHRESYSKKEITEEYNNAARASSEHEMVKWGSKDSMMNRFRLVLNEIDFSTVQTWLDVGCGTGAFQQMVYSSKDNPPNTIAIDIADELVDFAQKRINHSNCKFRCIDFPSLNSPSVDLITAIGVLQKTNVSVSEFFTHSYELLPEGGTLFIDTKHLGWEKFEEPNFSPEPNHRWFDREDVLTPAKEAGFNVIKFGGFLPKENRVVPPEKSHSIFLIAEREESK